MRLRIAKKIMWRVRWLNYTRHQVGVALRRYERCRTAKEANALWNEVFRRHMGLCPLTPEEAQRVYEESVPVPMSEERIQAIVDYATGHTGWPAKPQSAPSEQLGNGGR